ncbi:hypothetical protein U9M48_027468 [Paspalum notatum var. saurae]|uniref:RING-type domain-containing protein n=1 Tax=Paspalum notatum var. saurae TaxID=547442 RepID=A0AAQ3X0H1_PASNO
MPLIRGLAAFLARIACIILVPLGMFVGAMLYIIGVRSWGLAILVVVSVLLCVHWPFLMDDHDVHDGDDADDSLPMQVQQSAPGPALGLQRCGAIHGSGLGASAIAALPAHEYGKKTGDDDCAVCLGELQRGEVVKQLPACAHLFHKGCIDAWLRSHLTCPVCRSPVDSALPVAAEIVY